MPQLKLEQIESERGDLDKIIPALLQEYDGSQKLVARELGVAPSTVGLWLKDNGYIRKISYVKERKN